MGGGGGLFDGWRLKISRFDGWRLNFSSFDGWRLISFGLKFYHKILKLQSWTKVLTHLSKTNVFNRRPSVISKSMFFVDSQHPLSPYSMLQCASWTLWPGYNIEKGRGGRNVKIRHWKTHSFNETGLFRGVSQLLLSMIVWTIFYTLWNFPSFITVPSTQRYLASMFSKLWILSHTSRVQLLRHIG